MMHLTLIILIDKLNISLKMQHTCIGRNFFFLYSHILKHVCINIAIQWTDKLSTYSIRSYIH